jgi:hypothetical protein
MTYVDDFLKHPLGQHELKAIIDVRARRTSGCEELTFNVFNLTLDFDARTATVDDELDSTVSETVDLDTFFARVTGGRESPRGRSMSFIFEINRSTVWSPARDVGEASAACTQPPAM